MHKNHEEMAVLSNDLKKLSNQIYSLKRKEKTIDDETEKQLIREEIKFHQYQVLFYIDRIENLSMSS